MKKSSGSPKLVYGYQSFILSVRTVMTAALTIGCHPATEKINCFII